MASLLVALAAGTMDLDDIAESLLISNEYVYGANRVIGDFDTYIAGLPFGASVPVTATATAVPEPTAAVLAMIGAVVVGLRRRRR